MERVIIFVTAAVIAVMIAVLIYRARNFSRDVYSGYIEGMWRGDDTFCEDSGLTSMLLYIGDERHATHGVHDAARDGYLIMNPDVSNQKITIHYETTSGGFYDLAPYELATYVEYDTDDVMPNELTFTFDITQGRLNIYSKSEKKLYGVFYKDHELTSIASETTSTT